MGGKDETTVQNSSSEPWKPAQPYLKSNMALADKYVKNNTGAGVYGGPTVTQFSDATNRARKETLNFAGRNRANVVGESENILANGGFNQHQQASLDYLNKVGDNPFDLSGNDAYQRYKSRQLDDVADRTNLGASSAGRYGSGAHTGQLVDSLSGASDAMDMQQFGRMDALNSQRFNAGQQGIANMPAAYQMGQMPAQSLMGIGAQREDLVTRQNQANLNRFNEQQNRPWEQLAKANAIYTGAGSMGGTSTQTSQAPGQSPLATGIGYGTGLLGLAGGAKNLGFF